MLIGAALVGSAFVRVTLQDNALAREAVGVHGQIAMLEAQQAVLNAQIATQQTPAYIEQRARDYGYVKPGEGLASVRDGSPQQTRTSSAPDAKETILERVQRWIALFFHS
ncbi:MAG: hypothetical protein AUH85_05180 [Chloroflexi bacterium 13_1_40CM_4_68_4]|nr:MAG: hypothetical protein AUH85_05180 [Chloroflexi bacterium 13_1_40CM_4_68_4]